MKPQTKEEMLSGPYGATPAEAQAAVQMFEMLRPGLKVIRKNGRIETSHGTKTVLGLYRTIKEFIQT